MSPPPDVSRMTVAELGVALRALPYRASAFLLTRLVQGRSLEASAVFYGIPPGAFSIHLLRAGLALAQALSLPCRPPENAVEEEVWARALAEALERETAAIAPSLVGTVEACRRLRALGPEVAAALEAAEREEERSPKRQREDLLRRLAVLLLLGLTAWLYFNRPAEPPERPVPPRALPR